jgi:hypothetical protein
MTTGIDLSELWVSVWNNKTHGLKAIPINEALTDINKAIVDGREPEICVIAVMTSLENCLNYNRIIKRMMKTKTAVQDQQQGQPS